VELWKRRTRAGKKREERNEDEKQHEEHINLKKETKTKSD
jgi:hypothetical protein